MKVNIEIVAGTPNDPYTHPPFLLYVRDMNGRQLEKYKCNTKADCDALSHHFITFYTNFKLKSVKNDVLPIVK